MKINVSNNNFGITQGSLKAGVVYRDCNSQYVLACDEDYVAVSYTHLTLPTIHVECRSRWSPYH